MKEKSRFITFLLSFVPGLSHFYLGFRDRGVVFLLIFFILIFSLSGMAIVTHNDGFAAVLVFSLLVLWVIALIDVSSTKKKFIAEEYDGTGKKINEEDGEEMKESNRKAITLALSIIPGAGHMYLGQQKKGLTIMGAFFFTIFFMGWLNLSLFLFVLPLIWFYSFFDAFHCVEGNKPDEEVSFALPKIKSQWVGWIFIGIGILIVVERILYPLIPYEMRNYIQTTIVSLIFIIGGIRLLSKNKVKENKSDGDEDICEKDE
ncbi:hypothetical protein [Sporanaerobacter acetigenes]|uniref:TM2 domain-containing protein n=1 Tax=Sporanaerobacter acetigenes DSM 13106 TaxID=1123281 RepID=A0A1M5SCU6_9FIRM|nr:hypothetical protein [Sporanaerobacter acetigenes]SHH35723.1 hypothetical protein SAMN02745180_00123 [Sporanaerobacter acetigenes DSM 13106]